MPIIKIIYLEVLLWKIYEYDGCKLVNLVKEIDKVREIFDKERYLVVEIGF